MNCSVRILLLIFNLTGSVRLFFAGPSVPSNYITNQRRSAKPPHVSHLIIGAVSLVLLKFIIIFEEDIPDKRDIPLLPKSNFIPNSKITPFEIIAQIFDKHQEKYYLINCIPDVRTGSKINKY